MKNGQKNGRFAKGHSVKKGKASPGSGRTPDWLKEKCKQIVDKRKLVEFLGKVAGGENTEQVVTDQGETLSVPAPIKDRIKATEILLDRGFGKVSQPLEHSGEVGGRLLFIHPTESAGGSE